jgi:hypothetical protein
VSREVRPDDASYYEERLELLSQGDIFFDVPLAYPMPARELVTEEDRGYGGNRQFLSGPLDYGFAMLITPTCSMRSQGSGGGAQYAHPVRTLVAIHSLEGLGEVLDASATGLLRKYDSLINYMYLPALQALGMPESAALLYMPVTLHHEMIDGQRATQLTFEGAKQLHRKLAYFATGVLAPRDVYKPPMD